MTAEKSSVIEMLKTIQSIELQIFLEGNSIVDCDQYGDIRLSDTVHDLYFQIATELRKESRN